MLYYSSDIIRMINSEMRWPWSKNQGEEEGKQDTGGKARRKEITRKN